MDYKQLGHSQIKISRIVFGAWAIGGWLWGGTEENDAIEAIRVSIDHGVNTIDTAAVYGMGLSEQLIAKAIKGRRDQVVIATKCGMRWDSEEGADPWPQKDLAGKSITIRKNSKPASIVKECEQSLKRLGIDVIDLYQIHWPDSTTPLEDSWKEMVKLKEQGKVRAIGVSNYNLEQLKKVNGIYPVDSLQPPYSLLRRDIEYDLVPFCHKNKITTLVYSPLERGLLTGKVTMDRKFPKGDHRSEHPFYTPENRKRVLDALDQIQPIAQRHRATISQIIIQTTLQLGTIDAVIVGARNAEQAVENAKATLIKLSDDEVEFISNILNPKEIIVGAGSS
jgi:aryl-alcohol dehydrogenase-like predicted oxidoreductase